jgi:hypothetical protein
MRLSKWHSLPGDRREGKSGHGENTTEKGALTFWRPHREGQVRTRKKRMRSHKISDIEVMTDPIVLAVTFVQQQGTI